jgi:hypothetical protein
MGAFEGRKNSEIVAHAYMYRIVKYKTTIRGKKITEKQVSIDFSLSPYRRLFCSQMVWIWAILYILLCPVSMKFFQWGLILPYIENVPICSQ